MVSYFQAGSICDFVEERWGEGKLLDMVHSYAQLKTTPEAIQQNLSVAPEEFDKQYLAWIDHKYGEEAAHFDMWREKLKGLVTAAKQNQYDTILRDGPAIVAMYPEYVGEGSAYELIADAAKAQGNASAESAILASYVHQGGQAPALLKRLATLQESAGQHAESAATLERLNYVYPVKDEELHRRLADLLYAQKQFDGAVREYNALVASHPVDKAGAEFKLAQAYLAAGQKDKAQESVLAALETAPGFRPAQKLLLQLQEPSPKSN
jgi:cellulose synthase operon protein C